MNVASRARAVRRTGLALGVAAVVTLGGQALAERLAVPMICSRGPSDQRFNVAVTLPARAEVGSTYTIRLDGTTSGKISHFGLNHIRDMTVEYALPSGSTYVEGSARFVPGTGTANVVADARLGYRGGILTMTLPGKVLNDSEYTPPSLRVDVRATGAPGSFAVLSFNQFRLTANAFLVGDIAISCDPRPKPASIGATLLTAPPAPPQG